MSSALRLFYGGSFSPVHIGHARLMYELAWQINPQSISFVPCASWPSKHHGTESDEHRVAMLKLLAEELEASLQNGTNETRFDVELMELKKGGRSYTVESLGMLSRQYPEDVPVWIIGMDAWVNLSRWHQWRSLTDVGSLLVVNRPGFARDQISAEQKEWCASSEVSLEHFDSRGQICFVETTPVSISSSMVREQLQANRKATFLLPESVNHYVEKFQLYRKN